MRNLIPKLAYVVLVAAFVMVGAVIYWSSQSTDILDINAPITVVPPIASSETPVVLSLNYCKKIGATGSVRVSFVSQTAEIFQPVGSDSQPKGCHDLKAPILLPPATLVPPGRYKIKFHAVYKINPLKSVTKDFYTEEFTIQ